MIKNLRSITRTTGLFLLLLMGSLTSQIAHTQNAIASDKVTTTLLLDAVQVGDSIVAIGWRGHMIRSVDNGNTWQQFITETRSSLTALTFANDQLGWAVGHNSTILHTSDGGKTWNKQFEDLELKKGLFDIWFKNANEGWAVGSLGLAMHTNDGGKTWNNISDSIYNPDQYHYYGISGTKEGTIYIVGERDFTMNGGLIFHSKDSGKNWKQLPAASEGTLFGVAISPDQKKVYVYGILGNLYQATLGDTDNSGETFSKINVNTRETITNLTFTADQSVLAVGAKGLVITGNSNGAFRHRYEQARNDFTAVLPISASTAIVTGPKGLATISLP